jgi:protein TonB
MGLDENAVTAVQQFRFRPAIYNGKPVAFRVNIKEDFRIY